MRIIYADEDGKIKRQMRSISNDGVPSVVQALLVIHAPKIGDSITFMEDEEANDDTQD